MLNHLPGCVNNVNACFVLMIKVPFVTLSKAKGLATGWKCEILHCVQNDVVDRFCIHATGSYETNNNADTLRSDRVVVGERAQEIKKGGAIAPPEEKLI
jgi:hypothetical protein